MTESSGRGPGRLMPRRIRAVAAITTMAGIALLAAACGGGRSPAAGGSSRLAKAIAYTHCMRSHGMPSYPDPNSQGQLTTIGTVSGPDRPTVLSAENACRHLLEIYEASGGQLTGAQQQHALSQLVKYTDCMRAHGIPDFPDPTVGSGGIGFDTGRLQTASPQYVAAQQVCQSLAANAKR